MIEPDDKSRSAVEPFLFSDMAVLHVRCEQDEPHVFFQRQLVGLQQIWADLPEDYEEHRQEVLDKIVSSVPYARSFFVTGVFLLVACVIVGIYGFQEHLWKWILVGLPISLWLATSTKADFNYARWLNSLSRGTRIKILSHLRNCGLISSEEADELISRVEQAFSD